MRGTPPRASVPNLGVGAVGIVALLVLGACSTYRDHLNRGQRMYDENEYERALALWRN